MTIERISTLALHTTTLRDSGKVMAELADLQNQLSSGYKTTNFQGLNGQVEQFTGLEAKMRKSETYINNNSQVVARLKTMNTTLDQVIQVADDLKNLIALRRNPANDTSVFASQLESIRSQLSGQLNSTLEGRYLFGGTKTDIPPVQDEPFPEPTQLGIPDDNYYRGSKESLS